MTDHLTYSLPVPGPVKGCTRPQGQARDSTIIKGVSDVYRKLDGCRFNRAYSDVSYSVYSIETSFIRD